MIEGPRNPRDQEFPHVIEFLNNKLRSDADWSIDQEYPTVFTQTNTPNIQVIMDDNKVISHALAHPLFVKSVTGLFKVATIGSVVTDEAYRNNGYSSQSLLQCLESAKGRACDFALLWTDIYDFYRRINFELAGYEISYVLDKEIPR